MIINASFEAEKQEVCQKGKKKTQPRTKTSRMAKKVKMGRS